MSLITRSAGGWSDAEVLISKNAAHAAVVSMAIDPAGVRYAFSLNWKKRFRVDTGGGFGPEDFWHYSGSNPTHNRWFRLDSVAVQSGTWIAYIAGRNWGPIEVAHFRRTGDCGSFCGDNDCGGEEDACSCLYDCIDQCCIDAGVYDAGDADPSDPCYVCRPGEDQRAWTHDPEAPGCAPDEPGSDAPAEEAAEDIMSDMAAETPDVYDESTGDGVSTATDGCGCAIIIK